MGQDFFRRVVGYNYPNIVIGGGVIASGANLSVTLLDGPGEVFQLNTCQWAGTLANWNQINLLITVDGNTFYNGMLCDLINGVLTASFNHCCSSNVVVGGSTSSQSCVLRIQYESTCVFKFTNLTANSVSATVVVHSSVGR